MRQSITQEFEYGCGIACYAFALQISYQQATERLGSEQAKSTRFWVKDLVIALNAAGLMYTSKHVKHTEKSPNYKEGTIILIRRSKRYLTGHYLIRHNNHWMDPWMNLPYDNDIQNARSGYRKRLPGKAMYSINLAYDQPCRLQVF